jgi:hypothetical protein
MSVATKGPGLKDLVISLTSILRVERERKTRRKKIYKTTGKKREIKREKY